MTDAEILNLVEKTVVNFNDMMTQQCPGYSATPHQVNLTTLVYAVIKTLDEAGKLKP